MPVTWLFAAAAAFELSVEVAAAFRSTSMAIGSMLPACCTLCGAGASITLRPTVVCAEDVVKRKNEKRTHRERAEK